MEVMKPNRIPILCFYSVLSYVNYSTASNEAKLNDLKAFYNEFDYKHKCFFKKAVYEMEDHYTSNKIFLPKWLIQFEKFIENESSGS